MKKPLVFCLMGPTASGKTALSLTLGQQLPIEIINVDSAQIYQGMDIGTGKPTLAERSQVPHHLIDFLDPGIAYSIAQFRKDAVQTIDAIVSRNKIPLLVGGSMLYFKALQQGLTDLPASVPAIRAQLETLQQEEGLATLYQKLVTIDPLTANRIAPTDPQRILRALEVYQLTGKALSHWFAQDSLIPSSYTFINIGLIPDVTPRVELHTRIAERFEKMLEEGLEDEVKKLIQRKLDPTLPAMRSVGYRQVYQYLLEGHSFEEMKEKAIAATRQLAKRQLTWLRQWPKLNILDLKDPQLFNKTLNLFTN